MYSITHFLRCLMLDPVRVPLAVDSCYWCMSCSFRNDCPHASVIVWCYCLFISSHVVSVSHGGSMHSSLSQTAQPGSRSGEQCGPCTCPATSDGVTFLSNLSPPSQTFSPPTPTPSVSVQSEYIVCVAPHCTLKALMYLKQNWKMNRCSIISS